MAIGNPINLTSNVEGKSISVSATAGQTQFTVTGGYRINQISVYRNGVRLVDGRDFTATDGSIVTLLSAASVDDVVEFQVFDDFRVSDALNVNSGGTVNGDVTVTGSLTGTATTATNAQGLTGSPDIAVTNITAGIITATTFSGNGSALTGVASTDNIITGTAATFTSDVNIADSIIHVGDTNTKIRFPAADTFTVETAGSERLRVDSGGDVGIGTATVDNTLHVYKSGDGQTPVFFETSNGTEGELRFYNDSNGWSLDSGGNLRFVTGRTGNGSPTRLSIDSSGTAAFTGDVSIADKIIHTGDTDTAIRFPAANTLAVETAGSEALRVDSSGRVLVKLGSSITSEAGEAHTPALQVAHVGGNLTNLGISVSRFQASNPNSVPIILQKSRNSTIGSHTIVQDDDALGRVEFAGSDGAKFVTAASIIADVDGTPGTDDMPGRLQFMTTADGASQPTERLRIDSAGDMGLGVTPDNVGSMRTLHIKGPSGEGAAIRLQDNGDTPGSSDAQIYKNSAALYLRVDGTDPLIAYLNSAERLRLTSGGELLVGHDSVIANMKFGGSGDFGSHAEIVGANRGFANGLAILNYDASATIPAILKLGSSRNDTTGSNTIVGNSGDNCASIQFMGNDGTRFIDLARIDGVTDGTPGANDMPGRLSFFTTADGASVVTERMRIHNSGVVSFNNGIELGSGLDATAANTLEDYEEGTFTPTASGFTVSGTTTMSGKYVKIGQQVTVGIKFANTGTIAYGVSCNISLPFTMAAGTEANGLLGMLMNSNSESFNSNQNGTQCKLDGEGGSRFFVGSFTTTSSGEVLLFGGTYISNQ